MLNDPLSCLIIDDLHIVGKYVIYVLMSLIILDILSLSDRRSSGFCSDSERRESLGSGRHGLVSKMVFWICFFFFLVICILEGTGWSQRWSFGLVFLFLGPWKARVGHKHGLLD